MSLIGTYGGEDDVRLAQARITANQAGALVSGGSSGDATVTVNVGQTTTIAPGTPASVTNSGTDTDAVFNFNIPAGFNGAKGDQGIQGIQGEQGIQGVPGAKGDPGEPGIQGVKGDKGDTGIGAIDGLTKFSWTGSQAINTLTSLNLTTLVTKGVDTVGATIATGTIKLTSRGGTTQTNLGIRVRATGTIAGSTGTDRFYQIQLRRADGTTVIENINLVKASGTNVTNASAYFATFYTGTTDPFVVDGLQIHLVNGDDGTLTLTSVDVNFYATAI